MTQRRPPLLPVPLVVAIVAGAALLGAALGPTGALAAGGRESATLAESDLGTIRGAVPLRGLIVDLVAVTPGDSG